MAEIPSLTEAYTVIILLAPGFLTFRLFAWRASYEFVFNNFEITLWSLISSVIVFVPFAAIWKFQSITDLENMVLQFNVIGSYFVLAVVIGLVAGEFVRRKWRKNIATGSVWARFAFANIGDWVDIHSNKGLVYRGWIKQMSTHDKHNREVELSEPELLIIEGKNKKWKKSGDTILFTEKDIARIVLLR